jgi:ATP-dependent DNA helicase DinG
MGGRMAGIAPTGTGKTFAALAEAAVGAVDYGERWIISTESISLLSQYVDKDGPVASEAAAATLGRPIKIAPLKGWAQYSCVMKARDTAMQMGIPIPASESRIVNVAQRVAKTKLGSTVMVDGNEYSTATMQPMVAYALAVHANENIPGDRASYTGTASDMEWGTVSVSTNECLGEAACPLAAICKPLRSRELAAEADIVITNHSMLAVQAATATPVVIGSNKLGIFHGIIVDEAHTLPGIVRKQGQSQISGRRIASVNRRVRGILNEHEPTVSRWLDDGRGMVDAVDTEISDALPRNPRDESKIPEDRDPLISTGDILTEWLKRGAKMVIAGTAKSANMSSIIGGKRLVGEIEQMLRDVDAVRTHRVGTARWLEAAKQQTPAERAVRREWASAEAAPVLVGRMIDRNLWNEVTKSEEDDGEDDVRPLSVICMSATLPAGFAREVGLDVVLGSYASPFDDAYRKSMIYIPRAVDQVDIEALGTNAYGKFKFDTAKHKVWAAEKMLRLTEANHGSALILSATSSAGKFYAAQLTRAARGRWKVYSQWDGESVTVITKRWREDHSAVMVGTRSLMTGVDAPGETNTLVIVDRVPRAAGNPVDDARTEMIAAAIGGNKWAADQFVYVSDAALLMEQAFGRLIRHQTDSGLVAILDPRLLSVGPFSYPDASRKAYQESFRRFPVKKSVLADATNFLKSRKRR